MKCNQNFIHVIYVAILSACNLIGQPVDASPFKTVGDTLTDPCGQSFLIRGVNSGIAFPEDPSAKSLREISKTGANTVRLTFRWLINKSSPRLISMALKKAAENKMVAMPSIWDATGDWEVFPALYSAASSSDS